MTIQRRWREVRRQVRLWLLLRLPAGLLVRPTEWFLALLCTLSGATILASIGRAPAVEATVWTPVYYGWGGALVLGGVSLLCGVTSISHHGEHGYVIRRLPCYKLGLRLLGYASLLYAAALVLANGWNSIVASAITLTFAATMGVRLLTVTTVQAVR